MTAILHPELKDSVRIIGGVKYIHHPLAIMPLLFVEEIGLNQVNETHENLKRLIKEAKAERDWGRYLIHHQRPYRLQAFQDFCFELTPEEFWEQLEFVWTDAEGNSINIDTWRMLFSLHPEHRHRMMSESERNVLNALPVSFEVYRGYSEGLENGLSWTTDKAKAEWFAVRFKLNAPAMVVTGTVKQSDVIAYLLGRGESEILCFPESVESRRVEKVALLSSLNQLYRSFSQIQVPWDCILVDDGLLP
jgi:hypothetical protein